MCGVSRYMKGCAGVCVRMSACSKVGIYSVCHPMCVLRTEFSSSARAVGALNIPSSSIAVLFNHNSFPQKLNYLLFLRMCMLVLGK